MARYPGRQNHVPDGLPEYQREGVHLRRPNYFTGYGWNTDRAAGRSLLSIRYDRKLDPATPTQQQDFNNGNDGLFRWMPSINVDGSGNMSIGYSTSSTTVNPGIRVAGRLVTDPLNTL